MLTFYGLGMILGAGIYSIIGQAAGIVGEGLWQGFAAAAVSALLTALSYAELATMYPKAGSEFVYLTEAFPKRPTLAAMTGLMMIVAGCATASTVSLAFASYLSHFVEIPGAATASAVLAVGTAVSLAGISRSGGVNAVFTVIEAGGLILFVWLGSHEPAFGRALATAPSPALVSGAALVIFAYFGFENIANLAEEAKDPSRDVPRAIFLCLAISTVLYVLVSLAAVALLPPEKLAGSERALTDAAMTVSPRIAGILGGIALFSTANTALVSLVTTSRIAYGLAAGGALPQLFAKTDRRRKTPWTASLAVLALSLMLLPLGKVGTVASVSSFATLLAFVAVNGALIVLRRTAPANTRPFRAPLSAGGVPLTAVAGALVSLFLISRLDTEVLKLGVGLVAACVLVQIVYRGASGRKP